MNNQKLLSDVFASIESYLQDNNNVQKPIVNYKSPDELSNFFNFSVQKSAADEVEFSELISNYLEYSVRTGGKQFFNQLYAGFNLPAFIGDICSSLTNTSMYTYEVAPVATMIETAMIQLMNRYAGYDKGDGTFVTGGSNANLIAMFTARNQALPDTASTGYDNSSRLKIFVNEHAHYSLETAANLLGIGSNNIVKVKADSHGRLIPEQLEKQIKDAINSNEKPFFVAATCGTTIMGAYDPLDEMAEICSRYQLWLHADGSFGGSIILSDKHRYLINGIEKTDSFAWNPHKLMNIPLMCSVLLLKQNGLLEANITNINTDYLYHNFDEMPDLGQKSIQCGRTVDAVKLWFAWKYFGLDGYQKRIDNLMAMAKYAENSVEENPRLQLIFPRQSFTICFRYIPTFEFDLNEFNLRLRELLRTSGRTLVNYTTVDTMLIIRLVIANGELAKADIDLFFTSIIEAAAELEKIIQKD